NSRYIHPEQKRLLPTIKQTVANNKDIATMTKMNVRTVRRALKNHHKYGDVVPPKKGQVGRPRAMNGLDCFYLEALVEAKPDSTLAELQQGLYEGMGLAVDEATIGRSLKRLNYSFKKV
ncbi:hypothetical protein GGX14DRAFT_325563, partial [Mycena pura]